MRALGQSARPAGAEGLGCSGSAVVAPCGAHALRSGGVRTCTGWSGVRDVVVD